MKEYRVGDRIILEAQEAIGKECTGCFFEVFCDAAASGKIPVKIAKSISRATPNCFIEHYQKKVIFVEKKGDK